MKTHSRAVEVFASAGKLTIGDCKAIAAEHSAKGLLASGATAKRAVAAFDNRSNQALQQILQEVAARIDHRGWRWRRAMAEVEQALEEHLGSAPELLSDSFRLAQLSDEARQRAGADLIDQAAQALRQAFVAFRDGWTSPRSRSWHERNAVLYAVLLLIAGAIVGQLAPWIAKRVSGDINAGPTVATQSRPT